MTGVVSLIGTLGLLLISHQCQVVPPSIRTRQQHMALNLLFGDPPVSGNLQHVSLEYCTIDVHLITCIMFFLIVVNLKGEEM